MSDDISIPAPTYRIPRRRGMDPATRRLALIAAGIGGGLVVIVGGWSLVSHSRHGVPVVQAEPGPVRVKPANAGGLQVAGAGNEIFSGGSDTTVDKLAPPPEVPDPQALRAPPAPPKPAIVLPAPPAPGPAVATQAAAAQPAVAQTPRPVAAGTAAQFAPRTPGVAEHPSARVAEARGDTPERRPPPVEHAAARASERLGNKGALVQLAALSSEEAAKSEWQTLTRRMPELLAGHQPVFSKVEHAGHTFWRVRTGGFGDQTQARVFCERVRGKGLGCSVADF